MNQAKLMLMGKFQPIILGISRLMLTKHQPSPMMSDDQLEALAPWNEVVKENCSAEMK